MFPSRYLHIGSDETFELGLGRSRELVEKRGMGPVYAEHMRKTAELLKPLGKKLIFWGDIAEKNPEAISELPKDLIVASWTYKARDDFASHIAPFRKAGFDVWVCPGGGFFTLANTVLYEGPRQQARFFNELQKIALEKTRLKIPLLQTEEGTHGPIQIRKPARPESSRAYRRY